ncbi:MAG TPA: hypothetical protein VIH40_06450 [Xanthobacteraceae bacterium]
MLLTVQADDGDELHLHPLQVFADHVVVRLEVHNKVFAPSEIESVTLTLDQARSLSRTLAAIVQSMSPRPLAMCN